MWFQVDPVFPNTGTIASEDGVTIRANDDVGIKIYRHINFYDGGFRPVINFISNGGTHKQHILYSYDADRWDEVHLTCGPAAEPCCLSYPCTGYVCKT